MMTVAPGPFSDEKTLVLDHLWRLDEAEAGEQTIIAFERSHAERHIYRGVHPFNSLTGPRQLASTVWTPFKSSIGRVQRRLDILIAGYHDFEPGNSTWVVAMGQILGLFDSPLLGIPPTRKAVHLPFASAFRVSDGEIAETIEFLDVLSIMDQAGSNPYAASQTAAQLMSPGPRTHDGVLTERQAVEDGRKTLQLTKAMLDDLVDGGMCSPTSHLERFWHPDMNWFGPTGIGACLGFEGYQRGHTRPFEERLEFIDAKDARCVISEGQYAAYFWRPCLAMKSTGGFLGLPPIDTPGEMRVVDLYRRHGQKLAENWIFIDMLHFLKMLGEDTLETIIGNP
ncbi:MAG: nuclear transport factor 2 family protein [Rhodobacteraceae bacterium]|nr:nuclear transport factor 2 family protein [Paracoccaceae bacterium]